MGGLEEEERSGDSEQDVVGSARMLEIAERLWYIILSHDFHVEHVTKFHDSQDQRTW